MTSYWAINEAGFSVAILTSGGWLTMEMETPSAGEKEYRSWLAAGKEAFERMSYDGLVQSAMNDGSEK